MKFVIIVGKTASGKDTIARHLNDVLGIKQIVSYTTRPKRENETDGIEHYFISDEQMDAILKNASTNLIAYTRFHKTGYRYFAVDPDIDGTSDETRSYIINPDGIKWMKKNYYGNGKFFTVYIDCDEYTILKRATNIRGDKLDDVIKRLDSEREQFDAFKESGEYDLLFDNNCCNYSKSIAKLEVKLKEFMED